VNTIPYSNGGSDFIKANIFPDTARTDGPASVMFARWTINLAGG